MTERSDLFREEKDQLKYLGGLALLVGAGWLAATTYINPASDVVYLVLRGIAICLFVVIVIAAARRVRGASPAVKTVGVLLIAVSLAALVDTVNMMPGDIGLVRQALNWITR